MKANASATPLTKVTLMTVRAASTAPLAIGARRLGFFKQEGIDLQINYDVPQAQVPANVLAGNAQFGAVGWGALIGFAVAKTPLVGISGLTIGGKSVKDDALQLITLRDGPIKTLNDLRGKTIAVPDLRQQPEVELRYTLFKKVGFRADEFRVAQVGFADMSAALRAGRVDAVVMVEPFVAIASGQAPIRRLAALNANVTPGLPGGAIATSRSYLASNKRIVDAFRRAAARSLRWANRNPEKVNDYLPTFLKIDKSLVDRIIKPVWAPTPDLTKLSRYITIANNLGLLPAKPKPAEFAVLK